MIPHPHFLAQPSALQAPPTDASTMTFHFKDSAVARQFQDNITWVTLPAAPGVTLWPLCTLPGRLQMDSPCCLSLPGHAWKGQKIKSTALSIYSEAVDAGLKFCSWRQPVSAVLVSDMHVRLACVEASSHLQGIAPPTVTTVESDSCELSWLFMATSYSSGLLRTRGS